MATHLVLSERRRENSFARTWLYQIPLDLSEARFHVVFDRGFHCARRGHQLAVRVSEPCPDEPIPNESMGTITQNRFIIVLGGRAFEPLGGS